MLLGYDNGMQKYNYCIEVSLCVCVCVCVCVFGLPVCVCVCVCVCVPCVHSLLLLGTLLMAETQHE